MYLVCRFCEYEGKAERGLFPRPSRVKTKICPSCRANAYQEYWWEDWEVEEDYEAEASCSD